MARKVMPCSTSRESCMHEYYFFSGLFYISFIFPISLTIVFFTGVAIGRGRGFMLPTSNGAGITSAMGIQFFSRTDNFVNQLTLNLFVMNVKFLIVVSSIVPTTHRLGLLQFSFE